MGVYDLLKDKHMHGLHGKDKHIHGLDDKDKHIHGGLNELITNLGNIALKFAFLVFGITKVYRSGSDVNINMNLFLKTLVKN